MTGDAVASPNTGMKEKKDKKILIGIFFAVLIEIQYSANYLSIKC